MALANFSIQLFKGKELLDGTHPIVAMTTVDGVVRRVTLPKIRTNDPRPAVSVEQWNNEDRRVLRSNSNYKRINGIIEHFEVRGRQIIDRLAALGLPFDHDAFKTELLLSDEQRKAREQSKSDVFRMFDLIIDEMEKDGRVGTASAYRDAKSALRLYQCHGDKKRASECTTPMPFSAITSIREVKAWATFMISRGNSEASAGMRLRQLRAVLNRARAEHLITFDDIPFRNSWNPGGLRVSDYRAAIHPKPLSERDVHRLVTASPSESRTIWALDMFRLLLCMCGAHINDIAYLQKDNIQNGRLVYRRSKTIRTQRQAVEVSLSITPTMHSIFERYVDESSPFLLPILGEQHVTARQQKHAIQQATKMINDRLGRLSKELGLDIDVTSSSARYTAATFLKDLLVPPDIINELQGRANAGMLKHYAPAHKSHVLDSAQSRLWQRVLQVTTATSQASGVVVDAVPLSAF